MAQTLIPLAQHANTPLTMTSREIAGLVESRHDSVKRAIERCADRGAFHIPPLVEYLDSVGRGGQTEYQLDKRASLIVVAQLCPEFTARIVDRWQELEAKTTQPQPFELSRMDILKLAMESEEARLKAEAERDKATTQLAITAPKAQALDRIAQADGEMCITNAAKTIGVQPKKLFAWMEQHDWIYRRPGSKRHTAYQARIKSGYLTHKVTTVERSDGSEKVVESVIVTPKGLAKLAEVAA